MPSPEARYAVYLVDPGPDTPAALSVIQQVAGVSAAEAAGYLDELPCLVCYCESETAGRAIAERFRALEAVAVVRPAHHPLSPAPVEAVSFAAAHPALRWLLLALGVVQLVVAAYWVQEGRWATAVFGLLLAVYVLIYFGRRPGR